MPLSPIQRNVLRRYRAYRTRPFRLSRYATGMLPRVVALAAFVAIAWAFLSASLALFLGGMSVGALLFQGALAVQTGRIMPVLVDVIDWERVDRLLQDSGPA